MMWGISTHKALSWHFVSGYLSVEKGASCLTRIPRAHKRKTPRILMM